MNILSGGKKLIGVDLGASSVKALELKKKSGSGLSVSCFGQEDLGFDIEEKSPEEKKQAYVKALKKVISSCKFSTKNAAISISGNSVIVRFVRFPKMTPDELEKSLQFEAEPHIPFDISEVDMDTQIIGDVEEDGQVKMETVLVASKKETIKEKIEIIELAGLIPAVVDIDAFAVGNVYEALESEASGIAAMLVDIGASTTNISITDRGIAKVVRDLNVAGSSFTKAIQNAFMAETGQAEELKKRYGLTGGKELPEGEDGEDGKGEKVSEVLAVSVGELISEIERSVDFFASQSTTENRAVEKIILSGGGASLKGLKELVGSRLNLPVEIMSPFESRDLVGNANMPSLNLVTGLAMRWADDSG